MVTVRLLDWSQQTTNGLLWEGISCGDASIDNYRTHRISLSTLVSLIMFLNDWFSKYSALIPVSYTHLDVYKRQG